MPRSFVGFGFGPIQAGLFLQAAAQRGAFDRLVVAYRRPEVIAALRRAGGMLSLNVAHDDRIEHVRFGPVDLFDVQQAEDRAQLVGAIAEASELATALGSVADYRSDGPGSVHRLLAAGLARKTAPAVIYAAENHTRAAEALREAVLSALPESAPGLPVPVRFVNTVIGKMSATVEGAAELRSRSLEPVAPGLDRAFLVEAFSQVLCERVDLSGLERGLTIFEDKADLAPFEEAKLYGHNALHALAAYLGAAYGLETVREVTEPEGLYPFLRRAALGESGRALIRKYGGSDPLFTPAGFADFTDNLLGRMVNPFLNDTVERVGRDIPRKLGWDDRLVGTLRLALAQGIIPRRTAFGVAAALDRLDRLGEAEGYLTELWRGASPKPLEQEEILGLVTEARARFMQWRRVGMPPLDTFFGV